ncbi:Detected protein of confused Function [Hibiscus syriacus]|uniref:Detected protein of confused Function n=1 Tax=Hibiscus syriacus TaxID=106335 RepID=A0A6A2Z020_HIBSY|nr:Detected protein of confused Function [Hibiscus syriacus]
MTMMYLKLSLQKIATALLKIRTPQCLCMPMTSICYATMFLPRHPIGDPAPEVPIPMETLAEYGDDIDYIYLGYGIYTIEQYQGKEIEEIINSDGANPNVYVPSSGRWSINQEAPETKIKLTIDQGFDQYFSTLML